MDFDRQDPPAFSLNKPGSCKTLVMAT